MWREDDPVEAIKQEEIASSSLLWMFSLQYQSHPDIEDMYQVVISGQSRWEARSIRKSQNMAATWEGAERIPRMDLPDSDTDEVGIPSIAIEHGCTECAREFG